MAVVVGGGDMRCVRMLCRVGWGGVDGMWVGG